jgi:starvation-inducible outer membrane lipoprotein
MTDPDNVIRLRALANALARGEWLALTATCTTAADEIERLRAERDEARRSVCEMSIQLGGVYRRVGGKTVEVTTPEGCAEIMRWDCFKEGT